MRGADYRLGSGSAKAPVLRPGPLVTLHPWCLGPCGALTQARPGALGHVPSPPSQAVSVSPSLPNRKMATNFLAHEKIWFDKFKYDDAERQFYERMNGPVAGSSRQVGAALGAPGDCAGTGWGRTEAHLAPAALLQALAVGSLRVRPWICSRWDGAPPPCQTSRHTGAHQDGVWASGPLS